MPTTLYYSATDDEKATRHELTILPDYDLDDDTWNDSIAEQCAEDWHNNHDGFEAAWPRVFALYRDKKGPAFARFEVELETVPQFNAYAR